MTYEFKHGDRVTCKINGTYIDDARISVDEYGQSYICQNVIKGKDTDYKLGYKYSWYTASLYGKTSVTELKLMEKTLYNLEEGDIIVDHFGMERVVLGVCGKVYFISTLDGLSCYGTYTAYELKQKGYQVKQLELVETIKIDGKTYAKSDVVERVKELKEINI